MFYLLQWLGLRQFGRFLEHATENVSFLMLHEGRKNNSVSEPFLCLSHWLSCENDLAKTVSLRVCTGHRREIYEASLSSYKPLLGSVRQRRGLYIYSFCRGKGSLVFSFCGLIKTEQLHQNSHIQEKPFVSVMDHKDEQLSCFCIRAFPHFIIN